MNRDERLDPISGLCETCGQPIPDCRCRSAADGLRAALEGAILDGTPPQSTIGLSPSMFSEILDRFERAVRSWLREKAGKELTAAISAARDEYEAEWGSTKDIEPDMTAIFDRHLSPLFAALREERDKWRGDYNTLLDGINAEIALRQKAEALAEKRAEIARKAASECPDCKGNGYVEVCMRSGGSDLEGENVDPGEWDREDCERCTALREIAGSGGEEKP